MSESFDRLELMAADLHPTDETDLAKAEVVANLKGSRRHFAHVSTNSDRRLEGSLSAWRYRSDGERIAAPRERRSVHLPSRAG